jgi:hypothetical protein
MEAQAITFKTVLSKYSKPVTTDDTIVMLENSLCNEDNISLKQGVEVTNARLRPLVRTVGVWKLDSGN